MFTQRHIRYVKRHFTFRTGPNFGSSDFIGSLRGQSEMALNGMSSDPRNRVDNLDLILMRLGPKINVSIAEWDITG